MKAKKLVPLTLTALVLTACSQAGEELAQDTSAKAILDYETSLIILPLDEYKASPIDFTNYQKAYDIAYSQCFASKGQTYINQTYTVTGTRSYGLWNVAEAQKYGYSSSGDGPKTSPGAESNNQELMAQCEDQVVFLSDINPIKAEREELVARLSARAYSAAQNNPAWSEARKDWWACLEEAGLTPPHR